MPAKRYEESQENHLFVVELWGNAGRSWFVASWYSDPAHGECGLAVARTLKIARKIRASLRAAGFRKSRIRVFTGDPA